MRFCSLEPLPRCATLQHCLLRAQECLGQRLRPRYAARPSLFKLMQDRELRVGAHADCAYAIIFENGQHAGQALALFLLCVGAEARRAPHREQRSEHLLRCSRRSLAALLLERKFPAGRPRRARARRNFRESRTQTCWFAMGKQWICHSAWVARTAANWGARARDASPHILAHASFALVFTLEVVPLARLARRCPCLLPEPPAP